MKSILLIDDSEDICFSISEFFRYKGFYVEYANTVEEGLNILSERSFDLIILDYNMPKINGLTGVKLIRHLHKATPIIILTIEYNEELAFNFFNAGANDFAVKPVKMIDLFSRVSMHLSYSSLEVSSSEHPKGIDENTYEIIFNSIKNHNSYIDVESISIFTGIAAKTVNRYLTYMVSNNTLKIKTVYGKIGRPKKEYILT